MQVGILKTDHGPHSAEALAAATAAEIIEIGAGAAGETAIAGRKLELKIIDILEEHHEIVEHEEKELLATDHARLNHPYDCHDHVAHAVEEIVKAGSGTAWAEHFKDPAVVEQITQVIGKWFSTNQHVHRGWHADKHPETEHATEFRVRWNI